VSLRENLRYRFEEKTYLAEGIHRRWPFRALG
jgi:hypothetical protein